MVRVLDVADGSKQKLEANKKVKSEQNQKITKKDGIIQENTESKLITEALDHYYG